MEAGLGLRVVVVRRYTTPDALVDVDIALPGRDEPPGVTSPDRDPEDGKEKLIFFCFVIEEEEDLALKMRKPELIVSEKPSFGRKRHQSK